MNVNESFTLRKFKSLGSLCERPESEETQTAEIRGLLYHQRDGNDSRMGMGTVNMGRKGWL